MILNLRGSSCAGKSTICYRLLRDYPSVEVYEHGWNKHKPKLVGHLLTGDLFLAGGYSETGKTGGLDVMLSGRTQKVTDWLEEKCSHFSHVVYEALMPSLAIARYRDLGYRLEEAMVPGLPVAYAFLNTPVEVCRERILSRNGKTAEEVNLAATVDDSWGRLQVIRQRYVEQSLLVYDLDWRCAYEQAVALLQSHGWQPRAVGGRG